jgi:hypothetical protein
VAWSEQHALPQRPNHRRKEGARKEPEVKVGRDNAEDEKKAKKHKVDEHKPKEEEHMVEDRRSTAEVAHSRADAKRKRESFEIIRPKGPPLWKIREQEEKERQKNTKAKDITN